MKFFKQAWLLFAALVAVLTSGLHRTAQAETVWQPRCNRCCLPTHHYGHDIPHFGATEFAVANAVVGTGAASRKPFHFRATQLQVDHLRLDQVGLAITKGTDKIIATGRITHDGGGGSLIGSNVTIRIRAYVAASADTFQIPPDAAVVWTSQHNLWVSRGQEHISLVPKPGCLAQPERLTTYFDGITHLEVEMEYKRDR